MIELLISTPRRAGGKWPRRRGTPASAAFEEPLQELQLKDRSHPATMLVAKRIVELAKQAERDPIRLLKAGVNAS